MSTSDLQNLVGQAWRSLTCQSTDQPSHHGAVTFLWPCPSSRPPLHQTDQPLFSVSLRSTCRLPATNPDVRPHETPRLTSDPTNYGEDHLVFVCVSLCGVPPAFYLIAHPFQHNPKSNSNSQKLHWSFIPLLIHH